MTRKDRQFHRQFDALERLAPPLRKPMMALRRDRWRLLRLPLALLLIVGGLVSFLPFLGIWMLPLGLLLLAVDLRALRAPISGLIIRTRRNASIWLRRLRGKP